MPIAKSRKWTEAEIQDGIAAIKSHPGLWEEVENIEKATGEFTDTEAGLQEYRILKRLHQETMLNELADLYAAIRRHRRARLGLK